MHDTQSHSPSPESRVLSVLSKFHRMHSFQYRLMPHCSDQTSSGKSLGTLPHRCRAYFLLPQSFRYRNAQTNDHRLRPAWNHFQSLPLPICNHKMHNRQSQIPYPEFQIQSASYIRRMQNYKFQPDSLLPEYWHSPAHYTLQMHKNQSLRDSPELSHQSASYTDKMHDIRLSQA